MTWMLQARTDTRLIFFLWDKQNKEQLRRMSVLEAVTIIQL